MDLTVKPSVLQSKKINPCLPESALLKMIKQLLMQGYSGEYEFAPDFCISTHFTDKLNIDINIVRQLILDQDGKTLDQFLLELRIDKVKELLVYTEYSLSEIALKLNFESVEQLSSMFKELTGLKPDSLLEVKAKS